MSATPTCTVCESSGLPIAFTFHTVIATDEAFAPPMAATLKSHSASAAALQLPDLSQARYVLRSLRPGMYLHLFHEKPSDKLVRRAKDKLLWIKPALRDPYEAHWEVFRVVPGGALIPTDHPGFATGAPLACTLDGGSHIYTAMVYRLIDAHLAAGLWVAVSANLWDRQLRSSNMKNGKVMHRIDIPRALGAGGAETIRPDAAWLNQHVADFALFDLQHGPQPSPSPLAKLKGNGQNLVDRMAALAKGHPKTEGKAFVHVLADPVGTAAGAGDIARARYRQGLAYAYSQRHPIGAAVKIEFLRNQVYDGQLSAIQKTFRPLQSSDLYDTSGKPLFSESERRFAPKPTEMANWVWFGTMRHESFSQGQQYNKDIPKTARWLQLEGQPGAGAVIAPAADLAQVRTTQATRRMDRLHDARAAAAAVDRYRKQVNAFDVLIAQHDSDRAKLLTRPEFKAVFRTHFRADDPNTEGLSRLPGVTYMEEVTHALLGWGGVSADMAEVAKTALEAKADSDDGWALRGLVGNQEGLFSTVNGFGEHLTDWFTNPGNKLDKSFDTLKSLLGDEDINTHILKGRYGWLNKAGMGLSFGIAGFLAGAASHFVIQELKTAAAESANVQAAMRRAALFNAWCHQQSSLVAAIVNSAPPVRPVVVRVALTIEHALEVLIERQAQGNSYNRTTQGIFDQWKTLPTSARNATIELEFLTTHEDLKRAGSVNNLSLQAGAVRVPVRNLAGGTVLMQLTLEDLGKLYRATHRSNAIRAALQPLVHALGETAKLTINIPRSAVSGLGQQGGWYSIFGAWLQWRCLQNNQERIDMLNERLMTQNGLTQEQRDAIRDAIEVTNLGLLDNVCGVAGGLSEVAGVGANSLRLAGTASIGFAAAAFAGAGGAFMNAAQNFRKAQGKHTTGDSVFLWTYGATGILYGLAGTMFVGTGAEIGVHWFITRKALETSLRGAAGASFGYGVRLLGLSLTGWGLVLTVGAFTLEGVVTYYDRTELEKWVELCYFGLKPAFRGRDGKATNPILWDDEARAFERALSAAATDGATFK